MEFSSSTLEKVRIESVTRCPLCSSKKRKSFEIEQRAIQFKAVQCGACGLVYMDCVVNPDDMHFLYDGYNAGRNSVDKKLEAKRKIMYKLDLAYTLEHIDKTKDLKILDIGGGSGDFISLFPKHFKKIIIEVDQEAVKSGKRRFGDITFFKDFSEIPNGINYDCIIFRGTLQYMADLHKTSLFCGKRLKKGGKIILLAIPNADSILAQIQREYWALFNRIEHRYCFGLTQLELLFAKNFLLTNYDFPYLGSPYENYTEDLKKLLDILQNKKGIATKFPFWGSMLNAVLIKKK